MLLSTIEMMEKGERIKQEVLLIPELVRMTGMTTEQKKDFNTMKAIANQTIVNPSDRMEEIQNNIEYKINNIPKRFKIENNDFKINITDNKVDAY